MVECTVQIVNPTGLHARAAIKLIHLAHRFSAEITLHTQTRTADTRSILGLLMLDLGQGSQVLLRAHGKEEEKALDAIAGYLTGLRE